uniref:Trichothecene 3-O-acetyltransferase n=2 Tax=Talaromyces marneffei TaxID=37727 RepID=A0A093XJ26_TALMA
MWLSSRKPTPPPIVPTDLIIPFNYWDDDNTLRGLSFDVTFRFDDVLDSDKLRRALSRLLEIGNWRKHEWLGDTRPAAWLYSDSPQLSICIITFQDATLVTITFLHTLMDIMGLYSILQGWSAVLRGQEDEVPPFVGFDYDPLAGLTKTTPPQPYVFADKLLIGARRLIFALHYIFELFWYRQEEERVIFLPAKHLQRMRDSAMGELASQNISNEKPFVSESDVLLAWWTQVVLRALKLAPRRMITIRNVFDCRPILTELGHIPSTGGTLVANAAFSTFTFLSARHILEMPLSFVASRIRKSLEHQRNQEQLQALLAIQKATLDNEHHPTLFGDPSMFHFMCSNWGKARLFQVDFSAVAVGSASGIPLSERSNKIGRPSYVNVAGTKTYSTRNTGVVIGKGSAGNRWLLYTLRSMAWASIEQQLRLLSEEDGN